MSTERKQLEAAQARLSRVFELFVREHAGMLTAYIRAVIREPSAVDDLFQETMMAAWANFDECDLSRPFGPWLRGIASRLMSAHFRKRGMVLPIASAEMLNEISQQIAQVERRSGDTWAEKIDRLKECIESLPDHHRDAIRLRYLQEETAVHVASALKISVEALKKRLQRARRQLAGCLERHDVLRGAVS